MGVIDEVSSLPPVRQESVQLSIYYKLEMTVENSIFAVH